MILSTSHNFIFVHVPKTAGTALMTALAPYSANPRRTLWRSIMRRLPVREAPGRAYLRKHDPAARIIAKLGRDVYDGFHCFTVVRNPFDHAVSHFEFMKEFRIASVADKIAAMSFEQYLDYRAKHPFWNDTFFARQPDQSWFLLDAEGRIAVDRIMRFETPGADFATLKADLGLEGAELRHINRTKAKSDKRPFQSYYDATTLDMVRSIYARDFDLLGYPRDLPVGQAG